MTKNRTFFKEIRFLDFLAIVSIIGFTGIFINSLTGFDLTGWTDGFLFIVLGVALMLSGGVQFLFQYFEDGLTSEEITKLMTIIVGGSAFIVGIFAFPLNIFTGVRQIPLVGGVKTLVSFLAIVVITIDTWVARKVK